MILTRLHLLLSCTVHATLITVAVLGTATPAKSPRRPVGNVLPTIERPAAPVAIELPAVASEPESPGLVWSEPEFVEPFVAPPPPVPAETAWGGAPKSAARLDLTVIRLPRPAAVPAPPERGAEPAAAPASTPATPEATTVLTVVPGTNQPPAYPAIARRHGWQGTVLLRVRCDGANAVAVEIVRSSGRECLDEAALAAVRGWQFDGGPGELEVPIEFRLRA